MNEAILCSNCLKNVGLRREAGKFGPLTDETCSYCGNRGGIKLGQTAAEELFREFFCSGSQAAMYLPRVFTEGADDDDIHLEQSAQADYDLLKKLSGQTLRRHTPHLHEMGFTEIRSEIDEVLGQDPTSASEEVAERLRRNLTRLVGGGGEYELQKSERIYRARISPAHPLEPSEYDAPPSEKATANRIAVAGDRILCGAFDVETCLIEIKPHIDDLIHHKIFVASLRPTGTLKLLDFTGPIAGAASLELKITLRAFFEANQNSYHLTQLLSHFVQSRGYDGIVYPSAMECTASHSGTWKNVALFGAPLAENKLTVESVNRVLVRNILHSFDLGPAWDDETAGNYLAPYLKGWVKRANAVYNPT